MNSRAVLRQAVCLFVSVMLPLVGLCFPTEARQGKPVIISFGQPNIWSLEQAHYLLARLRSQGVGLQSKPFGPADLDPNDVNGTRLQMLKSMLGIGVGFNQAAGFQNEQATQELSFNQDRRHQLLARRDQRQAQLSDVGDQIAQLKIERERMNTDSAATDASKKLKDAEIEQQTARQSRLTTEVNALNSEINSIPATATTLATPAPPAATASPLPDSIVDKLLATSEFKNQLDTMPKLNAETKLDNYLNLQYEIIAKQLTLLRDEAGPGQRLVFLELPQSFYTVPDKANRKMAQVWWHVDSYYERTTAAKERPQVPSDCPNYEDQNGVKNPDTTEDQISKKKPGEAVWTRKPNPNAWEKRMQCNPYGSQRPRDERDILAGIERNTLSVAWNTTEEERLKAVKAEEEKRKDDIEKLNVTDEEKKAGKSQVGIEWYGYDAKDLARTVDLIPRQSALNVNDIQDKQKNFNLMGLFTWLSGIGVSLDFQRERRLYEQFLQQDVYASAFGKGKSDFGWTFGPKPGTERIAPGLQNTYAIIAVPDKAEAIKLTATGCYFPRSAYAPNNFDDTNESGDTLAAKSGSLQCTDKQQAQFTLVIPSTSENNFWLRGLEYRRVRPGEQATVYVHGDYFSPQIGVLVNGVALRHSVGLAQPELSVPAPQNSFAPTPVGDFEFVNSKLLVLSFSIPSFKGTPSIALVTPGRARIINNLRMVINDSYKCPKTLDKGKSAPKNCPVPEVEDDNGNIFYATDPEDSNKLLPVMYKLIGADDNVAEKDSIWVRLDDQPAMFSEDAPAQSLTVGELKVFPPAPNATKFKAQVTGSKFADGDEVRVNGVAVSSPTLLAPGLFEIEFPATDAPTLDVTIVHKGKGGEESAFNSKSFTNPFALHVDDTVNVIGYQPKHEPHPLLQVKLTGRGLVPRLTVGVPGANILNRKNSDTEMVLDLELVSDSKSFVITLTDPQTSASIPVVVNLPAEEKGAGGKKKSKIIKRKPKPRRGAATAKT